MYKKPETPITLGVTLGGENGLAFFKIIQMLLTVRFRALI